MNALEVPPPAGAIARWKALSTASIAPALPATAVFGGISTAAKLAIAAVGVGVCALVILALQPTAADEHSAPPAIANRPAATAGPATPGVAPAGPNVAQAGSNDMPAGPNLVPAGPNLVPAGPNNLAPAGPNNAPAVPGIAPAPLVTAPAPKLEVPDATKVVPKTSIPIPNEPGPLKTTIEEPDAMPAGTTGVSEGSILVISRQQGQVYLHTVQGDVLIFNSTPPSVSDPTIHATLEQFRVDDRVRIEWIWQEGRRVKAITRVEAIKPQEPPAAQPPW